MIRRQMLTLPGGRQVHLQRAGKGPPVLLLHQSPCSSNDMLALIARLSARFSVIAPDTPGNGLSDPIGLPFDTATMDDFADNIVAIMDALGIAEAPVYGFHTGAMAALALAARHPARAPLVIANGFITLSPELVEDFRTNYVVPFTPDWTGSHLAWWWARLRDQFIFFPYHRQGEDTRSNTDIPSLHFLQWNFNEFLLAGDDYRIPYACAFSFDGQANLAEARADLVVMGDATDILYPFLDQIGPVPDHVRVMRAQDPAAAEDLVESLLAALPALPDPQPPCPSAPVAGRLRADFVQLEAGSVRLLRNEDAAAGTPLLFLHDLGGSADTVARFMAGWIGRRPVLAPDLPGGGETRLAGPAADLAGQIDAVGQVLDRLGTGPVEVIGFGTGATLAVALAHRFPGRIKRIVAPRGFPDPAAAPPLMPADLVPDLAGTHVLKLWTMLRHRALFQPWDQPLAANAIPGSCDIAPDVLQAEFAAWLKAAPAMAHLAAELQAFALDAALDSLTVPVIVAERPLRGAIPKAAPGRLRLHPLPPAPDALVEALLPLIET